MPASPQCPSTHTHSKSRGGCASTLALQGAFLDTHFAAPPTAAGMVIYGLRGGVFRLQDPHHNALCSDCVPDTTQHYMNARHIVSLSRHFTAALCVQKAPASSQPTHMCSWLGESPAHLTGAQCSTWHIFTHTLHSARKGEKMPISYDEHRGLASRARQLGELLHLAWAGPGPSILTACRDSELTCSNHERLSRPRGTI